MRSPGQLLATLAAVVVALVAWTGLVLDFIDVSRWSGSVPATIWILLDYFTILTNVLVALGFTRLAFGQSVSARALAGLTLSILLVGIVYHLLLRGLYKLTPVGQMADDLLHRATPVLVPLHWLAVVPKGQLRLRDAVLWALYPLAYFVYAVVRGAATGHYPYPFLDVGRIGWAQVFETAGVIACGYVATGCALVWLDSLLAGRHGPRVE